MLSWKLTGAVTALAFAGTTLGAETLTCAFPDQKLDDWIRSQIVIKTDPAAATATVFDSLINQENSGPIAARISADNDKRLTVKWQLKRVELRHGYTPRIDYTLTYQKGSGAASVVAIAPELEDYSSSDRAGGNFGAKGRCKKR